MLIDYFDCQINLLGIYAPTNPAERNSFLRICTSFLFQPALGLFVVTSIVTIAN